MMHIQPSSYAAELHRQAIARRRKLWGIERKTNISRNREVLPVVVTDEPAAVQEAAAVEMDMTELFKEIEIRPLPIADLPHWKTQKTLFDAHVIDFRNQSAVFVKDFAISYAESLGRTWEEITGHRRMRKLVEDRYLVMAATRAKFPRLSDAHLGRIFNKDHTTIIYCLRKAGLKANTAEKRPVKMTVDVARKEINSLCQNRNVKLISLIRSYPTMELRKIRAEIIRDFLTKFEGSTYGHVQEIFGITRWTIYKIMKGERL